MNYLYGRKGMGQSSTLPGRESGGAYGQSCVYGGGNPDSPQGCPQGTRCTNVRGGSEIPGQRGVCMPTCISTVECPPGLVCVDGTCIHPPDINPPPPNPDNDNPKDGACPSWNNIPIVIDGQSRCMNPDEISDDDLRKTSAGTRRRLYNVRDLAVGRLGTTEDISDVQLNKYLASLSTGERKTKYGQISDMVRRLARSYELSRQVNEIAIIAGDPNMIKRTLSAEKEIRESIQILRRAQFTLRNIQIIETNTGFTITGTPIQGLGAAFVPVVIWTGVFLTTIFLGTELYEKVLRATDKEQIRIQRATTKFDAALKAWLDCYHEKEAAGMRREDILLVHNCGPEPKLADFLDREPSIQGPIDQLADSLGKFMFLGAVGAVGWIAIPLLKDYADDYRSKKSRS